MVPSHEWNHWIEARAAARQKSLAYPARTKDRLLWSAIANHYHSLIVMGTLLKRWEYQSIGGLPCWRRGDDSIQVLPGSTSEAVEARVFRVKRGGDVRIFEAYRPLRTFIQGWAFQ